MANHVSHAALPYPIKNARFTIIIPYLASDGTPTDPTTPDTEFSGDAGAFADCAEEVTTISGSNGEGYITLTGAETNYSLVGVAAKVASGPKATIATLYPRVLPIVWNGTLSAGSAGGGTLQTTAFPLFDITGCFIRTTGGTGGGGTGGANNQARKIMTYNTLTGAFTVAPNWETAPSTDTTYDVLLPDGMTMGALQALTAGYGNMMARQAKAQGGGAATITLDANCTTAQCASGDIINIISGTGAGQSNIVGVNGFNNTSKVATMIQNWEYTAPDNTSIFQIFKRGGDVPVASTELTAVKAKTDLLTFDASNNVKCHVIKINNRIITGLGIAGDLFTGS